MRQAVLMFWAAVLAASTAAAVIVSGGFRNAIPILIAILALLVNGLLLVNRTAEKRAGELEEALREAIVVLKTTADPSQRYVALFSLRSTVRRLEKNRSYLPMPRPLAFPLRVALLFAIEAACGEESDMLAAGDRRLVRGLTSSETAAAALPLFLERLHDRLLDGTTPARRTA